jgi:Zn-dependent alcohol dehydrogenase
MRGCKTIIAIDLSSFRLEVATSLGATHTINTSTLIGDLASEVKRLTEQRGVHVSLDTTGIHSLARQSWDFVRYHGKVLQVGLAKPQDRWDIPMAEHMNSGKQIIGCVEGDAIPERYIPEMLNWYREGRFPVNKIVSFYPVEDFEQAITDMRKGSAIKPILLWTPKKSSG